ncbi:MAG: molybdenum cofactor guanylyltransferase, partial [Thermovirgaceae bacterium]
KLFLNVDGRKMIDVMVSRVHPFCSEILLSCSTSDSEILYKTGISSGSPGKVDGIVTDSTPGKGPIEGLLQGMKAASNEWVFLVGCDMPCLMESVARRIWNCRKKDSSAVVPLLNGYREPLHAFYATRCIPAVERCLSQGARKATSFFGSITVTEISEDCFVDIPGYERSFMNINTYDQLLGWREELRRC